MEKSIFSKESLDRISSPEQLNDYVKVATPSVWMILCSIIILLIGAIIWGVFGRMDSFVSACAIAKDGQVVCYVSEDDIRKIEVGQEIRLNGNQYKVTNVLDNPIQVKENFTDYEKHVGKLIDGEWVFEVLTNASLPDGVSEAAIVTESIAGVSFIMN